MILIGQYDSPFVRRVGIAMRLYGMDFEHRPWSTFGDADKIAAFNPLIRVPTLVLDDGEALVESAAILDYLDELAGPEKALIADRGRARRDAMKVCALAMSLGDKAVSLLYENVLRSDQSELWTNRCRKQVTGGLDLLEKELAGRGMPFWFGTAIGHADIAVACIVRLTREAPPHIFSDERWPALAAHAGRCENLPPFREIVQPLRPPSR